MYQFRCVLITLELSTSGRVIPGKLFNWEHGHLSRVCVERERLNAKFSAVAGGSLMHVTRLRVYSVNLGILFVLLGAGVVSIRNLLFSL